MTTRIKGSNTSAVESGASRQVEPVRRAGAPAASTAAPAAAGDSVQITDAARRMAALQQHIASLPEVDAARVAQISQALEQGRYTVNPGKIADRIAQLESDLAAAAQRQKSR